MENLENRPSREELSQEAADMVEGNRALAERTSKDPNRGEGLHQERRASDNRVASARTSAKDFQEHVAADRAEFHDLQTRAENGQLSPEEAGRLEEVRSRLEVSEQRYEQQRQHMQVAEKKQEMLGKRHEGFTRDQELAARQPEAHAVDAVLQSHGIPGDAEAADHIHRMTKNTLAAREKGRKDAAQEAKEHEAWEKDQPMLIAVREDFERIKTACEQAARDAISQAKSPDMQKRFAEFAKNITSLESARFFKGKKLEEAKVLRAQAEELVKSITKPVWEALDQYREFHVRNSERFADEGLRQEKPSLNKIWPHTVYAFDSPRQKALIEAIKKQREEIAAFWEANHGLAEATSTEVRRLLKIDQEL